MTYELRDLTSKDLFPMMQIINKIGFREFKAAFNNVAMSTDENGNLDVGKIGFGVVIDLVGILTENLPKAETEIYNFLKNVSGLSVKQIQDMPPAEFAEMIMQVIEKPEFKDFFKVVSKRFK